MGCASISRSFGHFFLFCIFYNCLSKPYGTNCFMYHKWWSPSQLFHSFLTLFQRHFKKQNHNSNNHAKRERNFMVERYNHNLWFNNMTLFLLWSSYNADYVGIFWSLYVISHYHWLNTFITILMIKEVRFEIGFELWNYLK